MISYLFYRLAAAIPTLFLISLLIFAVIELPPGDYFETFLAEQEALGETVDPKKIEYLKETYGFDQPMPVRYATWVWGMLQGDFGYSFEYELPVNDVIGSRVWMTMLVSFITIIFTWLIAFPIGIYSATHKYSWGDYGLTFIGLMGLATPNFLLALILMYFANVWFGTSIGHLMDAQYIDEPMSWAKFVSVMEHLDYPGYRDRHGRNGSDDPPTAGQPSRRIAEAVCDHGKGQGRSALQGPGQISAAHVPQLLHFGYRQHSAIGDLRGGSGCHCAFARDHRSAADQRTQEPGHVSGRILPDDAGGADGDRCSDIGYCACLA